MRGILWLGLFYVCCGVFGCLTGIGLSRTADARETEQDIITEDNTPVPKQEDGVFFCGIPESEDSPIFTVIPTPTVTPVITTTPIPTPTSAATPVPVVREKEVVPEEELPSLGSMYANLENGPASAWAVTADTFNETPEPRITPETDVPEHSVLQTVTVPAKIFGQTPVMNRSDTYVTYFEFCYDLIACMEPMVQAEGLNMNLLLTKFALKALLCGVDVEKVDINAPIPRRQAALCLYLSARVLNEGGADTSAKSAEKYVTDISGCSSPEKKAIAYLYEQEIIKGYQIPGQKFYPREGLKTETGEEWLSGAVRSWK